MYNAYGRCAAWAMAMVSAGWRSTSSEEIESGRREPSLDGESSVAQQLWPTLTSEVD